MEMDLAKGFLFVTIISLVYLHSDINYVSKCPLTEEKWNETSKNYTCNIGNGESYHCLKTTIGGFLEGCFEKRGISFSEGCPVFHMENGRLKLQYIKCNDSKGCPDTERGGAFLSDKLYMYPSCIKQVYMSETSSTGYGSTGQMVTELKRFSIEANEDVGEEVTNDFEDTTVFTIVEANGDVGEEVTNDFEDTTVFIIVGGTAVIIITFGLICLVLFQCRRIKEFKSQGERATYMSSFPYNSNVPHIYQKETNIYDYVDDTDLKDDDE